MGRGKSLCLGVVGCVDVSNGEDDDGGGQKGTLQSNRVASEVGEGVVVHHGQKHKPGRLRPIQ